MRSLRLTNFRSLRDTQLLQLRPLTILVGANSSGKSSFLRFFPLLRQTVEAASRSPLLWYGTYVDFGDFSDAVGRQSANEAIGVEFEVSVRSGLARRYFTTEHYIPIKISLQLRQDQKTTHVKRCEISHGDVSCALEFAEDDMLTSMTSMGLDLTRRLTPDQYRVSSPHLVPTLDAGPRNDPDGFPLQHPFVEALATALRPYAHNRTKADTLFQQASRLSYRSADRVRSDLDTLQLRHLADMNDASYKRIQALVFAKDVPELLARARREVDLFASGVTYLAPFRQHPERFYRHQELSIAQIEPHGENLAMFLRALSPEQIADLSSFVHKYLGHSVKIEPAGSHVAIYIVEDNGTSFNLIDMGYGFSQVLPVITQCWATSRRLQLSGREPITTILAVEQPELHLHPSHQERLADMFVGVMSATRDVQTSSDRHDRRAMGSSQQQAARVVVETHSEVLVNRLGELVHAGTLSADDVCILLFQKDAQSGLTEVRQAAYQSDGTLTNWPVGFFSP